MSHIRVISPGMLTTVQDLGRPGYAHLGISAAGAADPLSLRAGNRLVGNWEGAAALEMTLLGAKIEFESSAIVALTGAAFEASIPMWQSVEVAPGEQICGGSARSGARGYLCVRGGIDLSPVLGSRSTHLGSRIGGLDGRALKKGDVLDIGTSATIESWPTGKIVNVPPFGPPSVLRVTTGPQWGWLDDDALYAAPWRVTDNSDRMGIRLHGPALPRRDGHMLTEGVPLGAIQVPPDGQPIILFVDHQTTGGYPKIANVISADFHALGQLRPREAVHFELVSIESALTLLREQEDWLHSLV